MGLVASRTMIVEANDKQKVIQARISRFLSSCRDKVEMTDREGMVGCFAQRVSNLIYSQNILALIGWNRQPNTDHASSVARSDIH